MTKLATSRLSATTSTLPASAESSSEKSEATQPVATTSGRCALDAACLMALRVLASASPVTAHVFMTITSASDSPPSECPAASSSLAMRSSSTRLTRQPRFTSATRTAPPDTGVVTSSYP